MRALLLLQTLRLRTLIAISLGCALCAVVGLLAPAPSQAQQVGLATQVLEGVKSRYTSVRTLHATFKGTSVQVGTERPLSGSIDWRDPDASRIEIVSGGTRTIRTQIDKRVRRWQQAHGGKLEEVLPPITSTQMPTLPLIPPFETIDAATATIEVRNEKGRPSLIDLTASLLRPIDAFTVTRLGIEDGSSLLRSLELRSEKGLSAIAIEFIEMVPNAELPVETFGPPKSR